MQRRQFLAASLAASALTLSRDAVAQHSEKEAALGGREFYQIRKYALFNGVQPKLAESYFSDALVPALGRMGMGPVGAFSLTFGPETPAYYVLIPSSSVQSLVEADLHLAEDAEFQKAAGPFWDAPASAPSFQRVESSLLIAFEGYAKITPPASAATKSKRIFQMRTYESPTYRDHVRKVEMFNKGEFGIFKTAGFQSVFYGDVLIGPRMPCLTYMLSMDDLEGLNAKWDAFSSNPDWKKLSADPRYAFEPTVSNISNLILAPLKASQI
jgi:hypothetical protein